VSCCILSGNVGRQWGSAIGGLPTFQVATNPHYGWTVISDLNRFNNGILIKTRVGCKINFYV